MDILLSGSDSESLSESSGSEDQDDIESMYGGQAQSIFSSLEKSIGKIDDFLAFGRGFLHGDIVCLITDPSGQLGRVVDIDMVVDLETIYGEIIKDINSKKLLRIRTFSPGDYVVHGPWLGRVRRVVDCVTILFDDGAKCELTAADSEALLPISPSPNILDDAQYPYYPGQRVRVRLSTVLKSAKWLCGVWKENRYEGTVCHVEAGLVHVDWVASATVGSNLNFPAPSCHQYSKDLTLLSCFPYANWQLGDWCILPIDDHRGIQEQVFLNIATQGFLSWNKKIGQQQSGLCVHCKEIYVVVKTKTKVDILWQDGSRSFGLDSQSLFPVNSVGDHEFWPEQLVLEKSTNDDLHVSSGQRFGIVKSVDAKERTVKVKWRTQMVNQTVDLGIDNNEETVSAYELIEHPDCSYSLGDVVFRFQKSHCIVQDDVIKGHDDQLKTNMEKYSFQQLGENHLKSKDISEGQDQYASNCYLSCIGTVTGFQNGSIEVRWVNGLTSKVGPYEIIGIEKYEESESDASDPYEEDTEDNLSQEMLDHGKQSWELKEKEMSEKAFRVTDEECKKNIWESSTFLLPRAAIGFFSNVAANLFGSRGSTSHSGLMTSGDFGGLNENYKPDPNKLPLEDVAKSESLCEKEELKHCSLNTEGCPSIGDELQMFREINLKPQIEETEENKGLILSGSEKLFKQFDIVDDCKDHHFVNGSGKELILSQMKRSWLKKVQQDWSILEKDLPDTIYVRVYEERIDLLRAAIVGAPGTPYHDNLFFFDFCFPPDYPHEPPLVHYNSGGLRLNPNLYESGRVCLSLLRTWTGTGTEVWNPGSSTILQVLLSLQALVLNEKPYFNEAGYDKQIGRAEGEKNSITYNENAFLLSCKSMLYLLQNPPKHFEALVEEHFRNHAHSILLACKAYMDGTPVGCALGRGITEQEPKKCSSMGFKIMLAKIFPKLVESFTDKGIDCSQFIEPGNEGVVN